MICSMTRAECIDSDSIFYYFYGDLGGAWNPSYVSLLFPDNKNYIALPVVLSGVYSIDDVPTNYDAWGDRIIQIGLEFLDWFSTEEQNIELTKSLYSRYSYRTSLPPVDQYISATRSVPAPSAVPLGYGLFWFDLWRQQYVSEDRYFGES